MRVSLRDAAAIAEVKPETIRKWVQRGHLGDYPDGIDVTELLHWLQQRNVEQAVGAVKASHAQYQRRIAS